VDYLCANILVFLCLSVLDLGPMYGATETSDRQTDVRRASSVNAPYSMGGGIITESFVRSVQEVFEKWKIY